MASVASKILTSKAGQTMAKNVATKKLEQFQENSSLSTVLGHTLSNILNDVGNETLDLSSRALYHTTHNVGPRIAETAGRVASKAIDTTGDVLSKTTDKATGAISQGVDKTTGAISQGVDKTTGAISQVADTASSAVSQVATGTGVTFLEVLKAFLNVISAVLILVMIVVLILWLVGVPVFGKSLKKSSSKTKDNYTVDTGISGVNLDDTNTEKYEGPLGLFIYMWDALVETVSDIFTPFYNMYSDLTVGTMASYNMSFFGKMDVNDISDDKKSIRNDYKEGRCNDVDNITGANPNQCISNLKSNKITWRLNSTDQIDNRKLPPELRRKDMSSITIDFKQHESGLYIPDCSSSYYTEQGRNAKTNILKNAGMNSDKTGFRCKIVQQSPIFKGFSGNKPLSNYNRVDSYS